MLVSTNIIIKVANNLYADYWRNLGYVFDDPKYRETIDLEVSVFDLTKGNQDPIECWCEACECFYKTRIGRNLHYCRLCVVKYSHKDGKRDHLYAQNSERMKGTSYGKLAIGKVDYSKISGNKHYRWNPNKKDFYKYRYHVHKLTGITYKKYKNEINPENLPRTRCGIDGGYQLDHKISIKYGFDNGIAPEDIANKENLQMLLWSENLSKYLKEYKESKNANNIRI